MFMLPDRQKEKMIIKKIRKNDPEVDPLRNHPLLILFIGMLSESRLGHYSFSTYPCRSFVLWYKVFQGR